MPRIRSLTVAAVMSLGALGLGGTHVHAALAPASDLSSDLQNAETGEHATTNDVDTAAEFNVDDGQVGQVGEQQTGENISGQAGDQQTGASATGQGTASSGQTGNEGASGESTGTATP